MTATGRLVEVEGERFYAIAGAAALPPFLVTVASDGDHWLFVSSTGGLTAGRRDPDHALFPYTTDDRLHDSAEHTGPRSVVRVDGAAPPWEPFSLRGEGRYRVSRTLSKSVPGNRLRFEETNQDLGLSFTYEWAPSRRFGFVRRAWLRNDGPRARDIALVDGLQNLLPAGLGRRFQMEYSTLADAYKDSEAVGSLGIFRLSSIPVDAPEPSEALRASTVWSTGLPGATVLLSSRQLDRFRRGETVDGEVRIRGQRGAYFAASALSLGPGQTHRWWLAADVDQDAAAVVATLELLRGADDLGAQLDADLARGTRDLVHVVASADGLQLTADQLGDARHFANTMFNVMRGGLPADGPWIDRDDLERFVAAANTRVHARQRSFLRTLPERLAHPALLARAAAHDDPDLERLVREYLPLTFSRRHGDPSRPWNVFRIALEERGRRILDYQGNWRDIFQNWEALALSFPGYLESMIARFVDASTADGHNPYRLARDGYDWEVADPADPWSHIGYWGDHQIIYLQRLLELSARHHPGTLAALLSRRLFTYADVPYRIKPFDELLADPQQTIVFDEAAHRAALARAAALGAEGKALMDGHGDPCRVTLAEKLLVTILARLASYVPGAGLWLTTQRPEWNDANNALVGNGASVVTLCHLRRFLSFARRLFGEAGPFVVSREVAEALRRMSAALLAHHPQEARPRAVLEALARPFSDYRVQIYARGFAGTSVLIEADELIALCDGALPHLDHSIRANRREDGLYHAYNLITVGADSVAVRRLDPMLEGQVAVLSAGLLSPAEALAVLDALRASALYRADQNSYLLYPERRLPPFLEKNRVPPEAVEASPLLQAMLAAGDGRLVARDSSGTVHFDAELRNARALARALDQLQSPARRERVDDGAFAPLVAAERASILNLYERVFDHRSFTGRSGTFYKYEGLGCIYWHMVGKLLVAVGEVREAAARLALDAGVVARLQAHYEQIRDGLGPSKPPALHGAFPIDPYSHTPAFAGAQQPGMTGQVKEELIARRWETGVTVDAGRLVFRPDLVRRADLLAAHGTFRYVGLDGQERELAVPPGALAFTLCQVPVLAHGAGPAGAIVTFRDRPPLATDGLILDADTSGELFARTGAVVRLEVRLDLPEQPS
jgi:hypothetical protein